MYGWSQISQFTGCFNISLHSSLAGNFIKLTQSGLCEAAIHKFEGVRIECISLKLVKSEHVDNSLDQHCSSNESTRGLEILFHKDLTGNKPENDHFLI